MYYHNVSYSQITLYKLFSKIVKTIGFLYIMILNDTKTINFSTVSDNIYLKHHLKEIYKV